MSETHGTIDVRRDGPVAIVTLGRGRGNVMGGRFFAELRSTFEELGRDDSRAVVVTGHGDDFSFGLDLAEAAGFLTPLLGASDASGRQAFLDLIRDWQAAVTALAACRKPTVAAVAGKCIGGGVDLVAACDVRVAAADAVFSVREARVAIVADLGSLQRLVGIIGDGHLRELALTGDDIGADRARAIGLVNDVLPDRSGALHAALDLARRMAANSPLVLRGIKDVLDAERGPRVEAGLRYTAVWNAAFLPSHDLGEALAAFSERRAPDFQGR